MKENLKKEIEEFVDDWHWDENSHNYAFGLGKFLFSFMDYLNEQNLSERTKRRHLENLGLIGMFAIQYEYMDEFYPEDIEDGTYNVDVYERKVSDSHSAVKGYITTCNKLDKYIKSKTYEVYLPKIEAQLAKE